MLPDAQFKVIDAVITPDAVLMVNRLTLEQFAFEMVGHGTDVLIDAVLAVGNNGVRIHGATNTSGQNDIARFVNSSASLPIGVSGSCVTTTLDASAFRLKTSTTLHSAGSHGGTAYDFHYPAVAFHIPHSDNKFRVVLTLATVSKRQHSQSPESLT